MNLDTLAPLNTRNGAFKGRGRNYVALLRCPVDGGRLGWQDGALQCEQDATHVYRFADGILRLHPPEQREPLDTLSAAHEAQCAAAGWHAAGEATFKSLPQTPLGGYPEDYWEQWAEATALLWRYLEAVRLARGEWPIAPLGEVAVLHAGMGWLAYALDVAGYTTLAFDARTGARYGLGAFPIARYFRVQSDPTHLPLARAAFDWVIFQEGLAPFGDVAAQREALQRAVDVLRVGGGVVVMAALEPRAEAVELARELLGEVGLQPLDARRRGWRGHLRDLAERAPWRSQQAPPLVVAQKRG